MTSSGTTSVGDGADDARGDGPAAAGGGPAWELLLPDRKSVV